MKRVLFSMERIRLNALGVSQDIEEDMETNTLQHVWANLSEDDRQDILERYMGFVLKRFGYTKPTQEADHEQESESGLSDGDV